MPKLSKSEEQARDDCLVAVLEYCMVMQGMNKARLSAIAGINQRTLYKRFSQPDTMTLGELRAVCKKLKIPPDMKLKLIDAL